MQESSVYQHLLETTGKEHYERGLQQGAREIALESLYSVLDYKFDSFAVRMLLTSLVDIKDIEVLKQLLNTALEVQDLEDFIQEWKSLENEQ